MRISKSTTAILWGLLMTMSSGSFAGRKPDRSIPELMAVVTDSSENVTPEERSRAIEDIGRHGSMEAAETLVRIIRADDVTKDPLSGHAYSAFWALNQIEDSAAASLVIPLLEHEHPGRRSSVVRVLGHLGGDDAVRSLTEVARKDREKFVRLEAVDALSEVYRREQKGPAGPALLSLLGEAQVGEKVLEILQRYTDRKNVEILHVALENAPSDDARAGLIRTLSFLGQKESAAPLFALEKRETNPEVRAPLLVALVRLAPPGDRAKVRKILAADLTNPSNQIAAVHALHQALERDHDDLDTEARKSLTTDLVPLLAVEDQSTRLRTAHLLAWLRAPGVTKALLARVPVEKDHYVRAACIAAAANSMSSAAEAKKLFKLIAADDNPRQMFQYFRKDVEHPPQAKWLALGLDDEDVWVRVPIIETLGRLGHPDATAPLIALMRQRKSGQDVDRAADALYETARKEHVPELLSLLNEKDIREERDIAKAIIHADRLDKFSHLWPLIEAGDERLKTLFDAAAREVYPGDAVIHLAALNAKDRYVRLDAIEALRHFDSPKVRTALCRALSSDEENADAIGRSLIAFPDPEAIGCVIDYLEKVGDSKPSVRDRMASWLQQVSGERLGKDAGVWRAWQTGGMGLGTKPKELLAALQGPNENGKFPRDVNQQRRWLAARTLVDKKHKRTLARAVPIIRAILEERGGQSTVKVALIDALAATGDAAHVDFLKTLVARGVPTVELGALARALKSFGDDSGLAALVEELKKQSGGSRREEILVELVKSTGREVRYDDAAWMER